MTKTPYYGLKSKKEYLKSQLDYFNKLLSQPLTEWKKREVLLKKYTIEKSLYPDKFKQTRKLP